jgi:hypothetical protein
MKAKRTVKVVFASAVVARIRITFARGADAAPPRRRRRSFTGRSRRR